MKHFKTPFRLFFLGASLLAIILPLLWVSILAGNIEPGGPLSPVTWHAHEMLYGYMVAVLSGFLLTATVHWTNHKTVGPYGLALLFSLWLLARCIHLLHWEFVGSAYIEFFFLLGVAIAIGKAIIASKRWRNLPFPLLLLVMAASDTLLHLAALGRIDYVWTTRSIWICMDSLALILLIFGGRIIPLFTKNKLSLSYKRDKSWLDYTALLAMSALLLVHALGLSHQIESIAWLTAGLLNIARLWGWNGSRALRVPLLMILHVGWLLTGLGMLLMAFVLYSPTSMPYSSALHLFFIGGLGTLTLGMLARVTRGHTGRATTASRPVQAAFASILIACIIRLAAPHVASSSYITMLWIAALAWSLSFSLYLLSNLVALVTPRPDGKPG